MLGVVLAGYLSSLHRISGMAYLSRCLNSLLTIWMQDPDVVVDVSDEPESVKADAESRSLAAFESVLNDSAKIQYDHYLLYYSRK